jgi:LPS O-antigen subunit length determinant protein (WzzB/FepE family)
MNSGGNNSDRALSMFDIIPFLYAKKRKILLYTLCLTAITAIIVSFLPNIYISKASILPTEDTENIDYKFYAAWVAGTVYDVDLNSSMLYPKIMKSNRILDELIETEYRFKQNDSEIILTIPEYFDENNRETLRRQLSKVITIDMDRETKVITLFSTTKYPGFSQVLLNELLSRLDNFLIEINRSIAGEKAEYLEEETSLRMVELEKAEKRLEDFRTVNRDWDNSTDPQLLRLQSELQREIEMISQAYVSLREQLNAARAEINSDLSSVKLLDYPSLPSLKTSPRRIISTIIIGIVSFLLASLFTLYADSFKRWSGHNFKSLIAEVKNEKSPVQY